MRRSPRAVKKRAKRFVSRLAIPVRPARGLARGVFVSGRAARSGGAPAAGRAGVDRRGGGLPRAGLSWR